MDFFRQHRIQGAVLAACFVSALVVPLGLHSLDAAADRRLLPPHPLGWWGTMAIGWLVPFAWTAMVGAALFAFEALARRCDPAGRATSSLVWTLKGWIPALIWSALAFAAMSVDGWADGVGTTIGVLIAIALLFFVGNAANVAPARAPVLWRPRWPGRLNMLLLACVLLATLAAFWLLARESASHWSAIHFVVIALAVVVYWFATLALHLVWLNRGRNGLLADVRRAWRADVFLPVLVQRARLWGTGLLVVIPLLPAAWLLIHVVPQYELALGACCNSGPWIVEASRAAVKWWWLAALTYAAFYEALPWSWWEPVSTSRLLVELGVVREDVLTPEDPHELAGSDSPTPPTRPDSSPASTTPPTA